MRVLYTANAYEALLAKGAEFVRGQNAGEMILLAASRSAADDFIRLRCESVAGVHRFTLPQFCSTLATAAIAERGLAPLNSLGAEALTARAIHMLSHEGGLTYFQPVAASPGFPRAAARTIRELRLADVPLTAVARTGAAGYDIASIARSYAELLTESRLADLATLLRLAKDALGTHRLAGLPVLLLDLPVQAALVTALLRETIGAAPAACALHLSGDDVSLQVLTELLGCEATGIADIPVTRLHAFRAHVFQPVTGPAVDADDSLDLFSAAGEGLEATEIARRIQVLAGEGVPFDQIAVLLRAPERYQPLLEEALRRAEIPYVFTRGAVRPDPAGRAFLALLACAQERFPATRFAEYLSLGQCPDLLQQRARQAGAGEVFGVEDDLLGEGWVEGVEPAPAASTAAPAAWEQLLVDAAVVGGRERWERRLQGLEREFLVRLQSPDNDEADRGHVEAQLSLLRNLQSLALPVIARLDELPRSASWREWLEQLSALAQETLCQPESVQLALNELWAMGDVGPVTLDEVAGVLSERLRFLRRPPAKRRYGHVLVAGIDEARGQTLDAVFLPGLAEGVFPKKVFEDPLLLDETRRLLDGSLPLRDDRASEERLRLRIAAAVARRQFVVSYPRMDVAQNRPRVPSFYALEIVRAAEGALPDLKSLERRAARGALTRLGWPAPADPAHSIDALEYDLSILHQALSLPVKEATGRGRFLLQLNDHLARALRARFRRWSSGWSLSDGLWDNSQPTQDLLAGFRLRRKAWSASSLQQFAACPYRFFLHGVVQLRPREESVPLEELDPLTRGSLFHETLFELFHQVRDWRSFETMADEVLDRTAASYADQLAPAIPRVWTGEVEDLRADLRGWLRRLLRDAEGWEVAHSEYAFGLAHEEKRDPHSTAWPAKILDGFLLRGSVDWIERHAVTGDLRITDHKTGRAPKNFPAYTGGGAYLQPLLYALAVEYHLKQTVKLSRLYFCTQRGNYEIAPMTPSARATADLQLALNLIDDCVARGTLPAAPGEKQCERCDYRTVCGPREEERTRRKPVFGPLAELRILP